MARKRNSQAHIKRHHSERFRAPGRLTERWTNAKAANIAFWLGQGKSSVEVSMIMRDGTSPETIRRMIRLWSIPLKGAPRGILVPLSWQRRKALADQAAKLGISPEEFLKRICECTIGDGLYLAVTDGKYAR